MDPQTLMHVVAKAAQIHGQYANMTQRQAELKALEARNAMKGELARELIRSLIDGRMEVVQNGFNRTLDVLCDQARHYMEESKEVRAEKRRVSDPITRLEIDAEIVRIEGELADIRRQAQSLYQDMCRVLIQIGGVALNVGAPLPLSADVQQTLLLPKN